MKNLKETIKVEQCFVAYLDILGYKELSKAQKQNDFLAQIYDFFNNFEKILDEVQEWVQELINAKYKPCETGQMSINKKVFSDNILLSIKITNNPKLDIYNWLVLIIICGRIQKDCLLKLNLMLRGAITFGDFFQDDVFAFGDSLIRAYELESTLAFYPRIIIDTLCLNFFDRYDPQKVLTLDTIKKESLFPDKDGIYYIDYLGKKNDKSKIVEDISNHKKFIELRKEELIRTDQAKICNYKICQKLGWLTNYHNEFCRKQGKIGNNYQLN